MDSTITWLTTQQAKELLLKRGPNKLPEKKPPTTFQLLLGQVKSPLVYILVVAAIITAFLGDYEDTVVIGIAIVWNTILGYYQENKAGKELEALKKMLQATVKVIRDGVRKSISVEDLVPWDIVSLKAGDKAAGDGKVLEANRLFMMEAMLTGESVPVTKEIGGDIFMGTIVQGGQGMMLIEKTGALTEIGKIATNLQGEDLTPLQKQLAHFSKQLTYITVGVSLLVFVLGVITGKNIVEIFTTSVALAVGAIPEGLLVALTAVLAIGMQRILKKKWLVKNLSSAETLGGVTVICSDKTGTLTQGNMAVINVVGDTDALALQALIANDQDNAVGIATAVWAKKNIYEATLQGQYERVDSIPFSSENKFFASLNKLNDKENVLFVNGAPDYLLEWSNLDAVHKQAIKKQLDELTTLGYRLVWYGKKILPSTITKLSVDDAKWWLEREGFLGMSDPIREDVKDALVKTQKAGIKLIVITWDFAQTAKHIMLQLGVEVSDKDIMLGTDLGTISDEDLTERFQRDAHVKLFARAKPEQKMRIVDILKKAGEVVAMMGDGVNDAPALKKADIGIVVNEASDVAKESANLILLDSSFNTIVDAVEEGRGMFDNIRKIILYLLCDAFVQIIAIIIAMLLKMPIPITTAQILRINLVSDGFPSLALTLDPKRKWLMNEPPRSPKTPLISWWIITLIVIVCSSAAIMSYRLFSHVLKVTQDMELARSVAFVCFGMTTMMYVYSVRTLKSPIWSESPLNNLWLIWGIIGGIGLIVAPFVFPVLGHFLNVVPIHGRWEDVIVIGFIIIIIIEIFKAIFRYEDKYKTKKSEDRVSMTT